MGVEEPLERFFQEAGNARLGLRVRAGRGSFGGGGQGQSFVTQHCGAGDEVLVRAHAAGNVFLQQRTQAQQHLALCGEHMPCCRIRGTGGGVQRVEELAQLREARHMRATAKRMDAAQQRVVRWGRLALQAGHEDVEVRAGLFGEDIPHPGAGVFRLEHCQCRLDRLHCRRSDFVGLELGEPVFDRDLVFDFGLGLGLGLGFGFGLEFRFWLRLGRRVCDRLQWRDSR